jgi:hypothetical protein
VRDHAITRTNPWGLKALAELCRQHGLPVIAWNETLDKLTDSERFLAIVDPCVMPPEPEREALVAWVRADLSDVKSYAMRWAEQAWRLAVGLHAAKHGRVAHNHPLALETAQSAIASWFADQQLEILTKSRHKSARKLEDEVLELLAESRERKKRDFVTAHDVHHARITQYAEEARNLLLQMQQAGILNGEDFVPKHGGKTSRRFRRNTGIVPRDKDDGNPFPG